MDCIGWLCWLLGGMLPSLGSWFFNINLYLFTYLLTYTFIYLWGHMHGQKIICRTWFSYSTMRVPRMEFRCSGLAGGAVTWGAISLGLSYCFVQLSYFIISTFKREKKIKKEKACVVLYPPTFLSGSWYDHLWSLSHGVILYDLWLMVWSFDLFFSCVMDMATSYPHWSPKQWNTWFGIWISKLWNK